MTITNQAVEMICKMYGDKFIDGRIQKAWDIPEKVIVVSAVCGGFYDKEQNPQLPYNPEEVRKEALECIEAGASGVHLHVRGPKGYSVGKLDYFHALIDPIREKYGSKVLVEGCSIAGRNFEEQVGVLKERLFEVSPVVPTAVFTGDTLFAFSPKFLEEHVRVMDENNCKPQIAVHTPGDVDNCERFLIKPRLLRKPYYWIILHGLPGCTPMPNAKAMCEGLLLTVNRIKEVDRESVIMVCAAGRASIYLPTLAILLGFHVRVGMEDTLWKYPHKNELITSNAEATSSIIEIARQLGRTAATAEDYRKIVGV